MPYRVLRTIKLGRGLARSPGDIFSKADIDEIPEKIRATRVQGLLDRKKIMWEDDPAQTVEDTKVIVREVLAEEAEKPTATKTVEGTKAVEVNKKKPGRPPKKEK